MMPRSSLSIPIWRPASLLKRPPQIRPFSTREPGVPTERSDPSIVHCITVNNVRDARSHPDTISPKQKTRSPIATKRDQTCDTTCPHSVCSHTLIGTYVTYAPDVTVAPLWSIPRHGAHPERIRGLCSSGTSRQMGPQRFPRRLDCDWERPRFRNERTSRTRRGGMRRARL